MEVCRLFDCPAYIKEVFINGISGIKFNKGAQKWRGIFVLQPRILCVHSAWNYYREGVKKHKFWSKEIEDRCRSPVWKETMVKKGFSLLLIIFFIERFPDVHCRNIC